MGHPVAHFEVMGANPDTLREFYTGIFGWSAEHSPQAGDPTEYTMITAGAGEEAIEGGIGKTQEGSRFLTFCVAVDDLAGTLAAVEGGRPLGGATVLPPTDIDPGLAMAQFSDPDGNVVGLVKES